jgi:hypothetical protein
MKILKWIIDWFANNNIADKEAELYFGGKDESNED